MRKLILLFCTLSAYVSTLQAQTDVDALRYGTPDVQGTARNMGL